MDLLGKARLAELRAQLPGLERKRQDAREKRDATVRHGLALAAAVPSYFDAAVQRNADQMLALVGAAALPRAADWDNPGWNSWLPGDPQEESRLRVGDLLDVGGVDAKVATACVPFLGRQTTLIVHSDANSADVGASLLQSIVIRTALLLPHQATYTLLDPSGAGSAFPMRRYLPMVRDSGADIRRDLDLVITEIQRVIETYLDAAIPSFEQIPPEMRLNERFHFIFAANFPNGYDRLAIEKLQQIANTGPRAGVYVFLHHNDASPLPRDMSLAQFKQARTLNVSAPLNLYGLVFQPETAPPAALQAELLEKVRLAKPPDRRVDWADSVGLSVDERWQATSQERIDTPIGARGNGQPLNMWFGVKNGRPVAHGMVVGMPGQGKSVFLHTLISGLAERYSPDELRFYLIDGKNGTEMQAHRGLPHAEVIALNTPTELARSVLTEGLNEMKRRTDLFLDAGVPDLSNYRDARPEEALPRLLIVIDEYQRLFDDDREDQASHDILQLAEQGRFAGIHILLCGHRFGAAGLRHQQAVFGSIHLRAALRLTVPDQQATTELGRRGKALLASCDSPGKIVVNDAAGEDGANQLGQVAFITLDQCAQQVSELSELATTKAIRTPRTVVFDGKAIPRILDNPVVDSLASMRTWPTATELQSLARSAPIDGGLGLTSWYAAERPSVGWIGRQLNVRGLTNVVFRRGPGEHALLVGSAHAERAGMLGAALASLALNAPPNALEFMIADCSIPDTEWSDILSLVHEAVLVRGGFRSSFNQVGRDIETMLNDLVIELDRRHSLDERALAAEPNIFVALAELNRVDTYRRQVGNYGMTESPGGASLARLCTEGGPLGIHLICAFDGARSLVSVFDERRGLPHFRHRVATQMGEDESHTIVRSRAASQLRTDTGEPPAALYYDLESDQPQRFKPYSSVFPTSRQPNAFRDDLREIGTALAIRNQI